MAAAFAFVCIDLPKAPGRPTPTRVRLDQIAAVEPSVSDDRHCRVTLLSGTVLIGTRSPGEVWDAMREAARWLETAVDDD